MNPEPTPANTRIQILDIIRGIAVFGILASNIFYFGLPSILNSSMPVTDPDGGAGYWVGMFSEIVISGKMRSLFAMLFGVSSIIILDGLAKRYTGQKSAEVFFRRLLWLLVIGQLHGFLLLFSGDILFHYALMGMIAYPLYRASSRVRWSVMFLCMVAMTIADFQYHEYATGLQEEYDRISLEAVPYEELSEEDQEIIDEWEYETDYIHSTEDDLAEEIEAKRGGYATAFEYNKEGVMEMASRHLYDYYAWDILLYMLLGISLFRKGIFRDDYPTKKLAGLAVFGLATGGALHIWLHLGFYSHYEDFGRSTFYLIFFEIGRFPMAIGYLGLICLVFRWQALSRLGKWLAAVGRMALTNYLMQSAIAAIIFSMFGYFNCLGRVELVWLTLAIWIFQLIFSNLWMSAFAYGPAEWVWRSLTNWRFQPLRKR